MSGLNLLLATFIQIFIIHNNETEFVRETGSSSMSGEAAGEEVVVVTSGGAVRGRLEQSLYGSKFYSFQRIPYARPPTGPLRFLPPVPAAAWEGELDGMQPRVNLESSIKWYWSTEDCLYLDVRTKALDTNRKLPVMVWIGGIGFTLDISSKLGVGMLTDKDVVIVNIGYRLGPFGFLTVREATAPGNCGLKDIVMALKWVRKNIASFGGDPSNVTLFGSGSGAAMIHFMMLSPMATGLFHKAILQSGCSFNNWALRKNPVKSTMILARELGITSEDPIEVVEVLRQLPEQVILEKFRQIMKINTEDENIPFCMTWFRPCIENEFEGQQAFITKSPLTILKSGKYNKVPFIIGCNRMEGLSFKYYMEEPSKRYELYSQNIHMVVPRELRVDNDGNCSNGRTIGKRLMQFYLQGETITEETCNNYFQFLTDYYFIYYINKCVKYHSEYGKSTPIYYYVFDYNGDWAFPQDLHIFNTLAHTGELPYLFNLRNEKFSGSRDSICTRERVITLWTNFAKYGNPTPDGNDELMQITWDPVTDKNKLNYLNIGPELTKGWNPFFERMSFWDTILNETTFARMSAVFSREKNNKYYEVI